MIGIIRLGKVLPLLTRVRIFTKRFFIGLLQFAHPLTLFLLTMILCMVAATVKYRKIEPSSVVRSTVIMKFDKSELGNNITLSDYLKKCKFGDAQRKFLFLSRSAQLSQKLFKNPDLIKKLFIVEWDEKKEKFDLVSKNDSISLIKKKIKYLLTGYEVKYVPPSPQRVQEKLNGLITIIPEKNESVFYIQSRTKDPILMTTLINLILNEVNVLFHEGCLKDINEENDSLKQFIKDSKSSLLRISASKEMLKNNFEILLLSEPFFQVYQFLIPPTVTYNNYRVGAHIYFIYAFCVGLFFFLSIFLINIFVKFPVWRNNPKH